MSSATTPDNANEGGEDHLKPFSYANISRTFSKSNQKKEIEDQIKNLKLKIKLNRGNVSQETMN